MIRTEPTKTINPAIQGLRGAAALTVMLVHVHFMSLNGGLTQSTGPAWIEDLGPYAVMLFFCISGYLITSTLSRHGDVGRFAFNRVARIYPVFGLLHLVMFTAGPFMNYEWMGALRRDPLAWMGHFVSNLLFLPGVFDLPIAQKNAWSLSYEAWFYLVAGLLFAGLRRRGSGRGIVLLCLALFMVCVVVWWEVKVVFFAVGALVCWAQQRGLLKTPPLAGILGMLGCAGGFWLYCQGSFLLSAVAALVFFAGLATGVGGLARLLSMAPLVWLGKISYSLYLLHPFVLDVLRRVCVKTASLFPAVPSLAVFWGVGILAALLASAACHALVEVRLTRFLFPKRG